MEGSEGITAPRKEYPRPRPRGVSDGEQLHTNGKERHSTERVFTFYQKRSRDARAKNQEAGMWVRW